MQSSSDGVRLRVLVKPLSRESKLICEPNGTLVMHVTAPPVKGKANREIVKWLARKVHKPSSNVRLVSGLHSDVKVVLIKGMTQGEVASALGIDLTNQSQSKQNK